MILESVCDEQKAGYLVDGRAKRYGGAMESQGARLGASGTKSLGNTALDCSCTRRESVAKAGDSSASHGESSTKRNRAWRGESDVEVTADLISRPVPAIEFFSRKSEVKFKRRKVTASKESSPLVCSSLQSFRRFASQLTRGRLVHLSVSFPSVC